MPTEQLKHAAWFARVVAGAVDLPAAPDVIGWVCARCGLVLPLYARECPTCERGAACEERRRFDTTT